MARRKNEEGQTKAKKVIFVIKAPEARKVMLAGDFNNWDFNSTPLRKSKKQEWQKSMTLKPGRYQYKFVIDGNWIIDPSNTNLEYSSLGTENSVIEIA